uniref:Uncharacterized protein n=1 Tax=Strigamia maritima TaxID=126957 RepID=T1JJL5_STRMM
MTTENKEVRLNLPSGQVLKDCRSDLWILDKSIGAGYKGEVYAANAGSNVGYYGHHFYETDSKYAIKIVST